MEVSLQEIWADLEGFPHYAVSNYGQIMNVNRDRILATRPGNQGISMITMMSADGIQVTRSVALLVARAFLPDEGDAFDSIICLDGNRMNCRADNLMRRPRWFAMRYHGQFSDMRFYHRGVSIRLLGTDEVHDGWSPFCVKYGLFYQNIISSCHNHLQRIFPTGQQFRIV